MDGLMLVRNVMLSNHIAEMRLPKGIVASYRWALEGRG
jgi:hypothetical protein